jgi:hypothetical protein
MIYIVKNVLKNYLKTNKMGDFTMCNGKNCDLASTCYRYKAEPSMYRQSYFVESPIEDGQCDYYWETKD